MQSDSLISGTANPSNLAVATFAARDSGPDTDPHSTFWANASSVVAANDNLGRPVPGHRTEILIQWTPANLYLLYVCAYQNLNLKPNPDLTAETNQLWDWDVAEVFVGSDFENIHRYKELQVSPQGEWVDLDVDSNDRAHEVGWTWKSGCQVAARIDAPRKIWYGFMRIPWIAIDTRPAAPGNELRINFLRCQDYEPNRKLIAWQPSHQPTFHIPESFGILRLAAPEHRLTL